MDYIARTRQTSISPICTYAFCGLTAGLSGGTRTHENPPYPKYGALAKLSYTQIQCGTIAVPALFSADLKGCVCKE